MPEFDIDVILRDHITQGDTGSGTHKPQKSQLRAYLKALEYGLLNQYDSSADVQSSSVSSIVSAIRLNGFQAAGDGGSALYVRVDAEPVHPGKFRSTDRYLSDGSSDDANGGWWEYADLEVNAKAFGVVADGVTDDATALQNAIEVARVLNRWPVVLPPGVINLDSAIYLPTNARLVGRGRHPVLRERGDTTGGVAHPAYGTLLLVTANQTAALWTDESGDGSDVTRRVGLALLGENSSIENMTVQGAAGLSQTDILIQVCGVSRYRIEHCDILGPCTGLRLDGTWGSGNASLTGLSHLPDWFDVDYITLFPLGMTNGLLYGCHVTGAPALVLETGDVEAEAANGVSDTLVFACEFYSDLSASTLTWRESTSGTVIRLNFRLDALGGGQGLAFVHCRVDASCYWAIDVGRLSSLDWHGGREFIETSQDWITYQQGEGVAVQEERARINVSTNAFVNQGNKFVLKGEIQANIAVDGSGNTRPRDFEYRHEGGKRIDIEVHDGVSNEHFHSDGEVAQVNPTYKSATGIFLFQSVESNILDSVFGVRRSAAGKSEISFDGGTTWVAYETGTFTPVLQGATVAGSNSYTAQLGRYIKIGRFVFISCRLQVTGSVDGAMSGNIQIGGLPFTSFNDSAVSGSPAFADIANINLSSGTQLVGFLGQNSDAINLSERGNTGDSSITATGKFGSNFRVYFTMVYEASS